MTAELRIRKKTNKNDLEKNHENDWKVHEMYVRCVQIATDLHYYRIYSNYHFPTSYSGRRWTGWKKLGKYWRQCQINTTSYIGLSFY